MDTVKTGKEFLDSFFSEIESDDTLNAEVVQVLINLFRENKFTNTNIENKLSELRRNEEKS